MVSSTPEVHPAVWLTIYLRLFGLLAVSVHGTLLQAIPFLTSSSKFDP